MRKRRIKKITNNRKTKRLISLRRTIALQRRRASYFSQTKDEQGKIITGRKETFIKRIMRSGKSWRRFVQD